MEEATGVNYFIQKVRQRVLEYSFAILQLCIFNSYISGPCHILHCYWLGHVRVRFLLIYSGKAVTLRLEKRGVPASFYLRSGKASEILAHAEPNHKLHFALVLVFAS
jgi:hypothetical protein